MPVQNRIQLRRGTAAAGANQWTNQVLYIGELGYETDTGKFKIGDGITQWSSLPYAAVLPSELNESVDDRINDLLVGGSGVVLNYNDSGNSLTISSPLTAGTGVSLAYSSGNYTINLDTSLISASGLSGLDEAIDDRVNGLLVSGSGIQLNYNDNSNTLTVSATGLALSNHTHTLSSGATDVTATASEVNALDLTTGAGTAEANKAVVLDGSKNITGLNDVTSSGTLNVGIVSTTGNVTVGGNLIVNGSTTTVNSTVVTIDDPVFTIGGDVAASGDDNKDRGIAFNYYNGSSKTGFFGYSDASGKWKFIPDATNTSEVFSGTVGELDAKVDWSNINSKPSPIIAVNISGDISGSGNLTMSELAGGTININSTIQANSVALGTDTTGDYVSSILVSGTGLGVSGSGENATYTITSNATADNTANTIVSRDSSGNFSAGAITSTSISGSGSGLTDLNASNISTGTLSVNILPTGIPVTNLASSGITIGATTINLGNTTNNISGLSYISGTSINSPTTLYYVIIDGGTP
jgi:hypothetical protein